MARPRQPLIRRISALAIAMLAVLVGHTSAHAQTHRAALVVQHGAGWQGARVLFRCVEFAQQAISGIALLELAGVNSGQPPQVYDWGAGAETVCQIDHEPRAVPDRCFGPMSGPNWSDWSLSSAGWLPRPSGVGGYSIHDGDVEGWSYSIGYGTPPPATRFSQVCPPAPTPTSQSVAAAPALTSAPKSAAAKGAPTWSPPTSQQSATGSPLALAPTATTPATALSAASASPPAAAPSSPPSPIWLVLAASALSLMGLAAVNLRRRPR
jgi:hypothetical protein